MLRLSLSMSRAKLLMALNNMAFSFLMSPTGMGTCFCFNMSRSFWTATMKGLGGLTGRIGTGAGGGGGGGGSSCTWGKTAGNGGVTDSSNKRRPWRELNVLLCHALTPPALRDS